MAKSVVFVCAFNKGRSVALEHIFRHLLRKRVGKLAQQVKVSSAGLLIKQDINYLQYLVEQMDFPEIVHDRVFEAAGVKSHQ